MTNLDLAFAINTTHRHYKHTKIFLKRNVLLLSVSKKYIAEH